MPHVTRTFLRGLLALLPLALSVYILVWLFAWVEALADRLILWFLPEFLYFPGLGILVGVLLIYGFGLLMAKEGMQKILEKAEVPFTSVPLVKSVYFAIKDFINYFAPKENEERASSVVVVRFPGFDVDVVGLLTNSHPDGLPAGIRTDGRVAVYFPMSYQIGGYTLFIPTEWISEVDTDVESAMRMILTAWMPGGQRKRELDPIRRMHEELQSDQPIDRGTDPGVSTPDPGRA